MTVVFLLIAVILGTLLRISLIIIYPLIAIFVAAYFRLRVSHSLLMLLGLAGTSTFLSFFPHLFWRYKAFSLFYMLPFLLLLFADPGKERFKNINLLDIFMKCLAFVALINDLVGFMQVIRHPGSDDSFTGIYSQFSISLNGLMLLNAVIFFYYFVKYIYLKHTANLFISLFFLLSAVLCFYGAGLAVCIVAFIMSFFSINVKSFFKTFFGGILSIILIYFLMMMIKPDTLNYNITNIKKLSSFNGSNGARKLTSFYNYFISYPLNAKDFLFGSGPGTYNSRSAFMVGSPSYFREVSFIKDTEQPYYFKHYAYSLWNEKNTIQSLYLDGFRNQPFSSILAFLGEYGILFTAAFVFLYFMHYRRMAKLYSLYKNDPQISTSFRLLKFLILLLPLLLLIDNYFEYPEIMLLILLGLKTAEINLFTKMQANAA
ncbi:MAG: hypothetical protein H0W12_01505 [Chitinophagaceae bacterium]|nr:hypothetical protein [Chitinophagaceae bacterium]